MRSLESPAKKLARLEFWRSARKYLGETRFILGPHVVLAGQHGGDISVLLGLGVRESSIVAVDSNKDNAASCKWLWPRINVRHAQVHDVLSGLSDVASCFLDFCSPICDESLSTLEAALPSLSGSWLGVTFMAAREQASYKAIYEKTAPTARKKEDIRPLMFRAIDRNKGGGNAFIDEEWMYYVGHNEVRFGKPMVLGMGAVRKTKVARRSKISVKNVSVTSDVFARMVVNDRASVGPKALLLYALNDQSVAAYKAHLTRGTY